MPKPGYMICSQSGSLDQFANAVSCFYIMEVIQFFKMPPGQPGQKVKFTGPPSGIPRPIFMRLAATWLKEETDSLEQAFVSQVVARFPNQSEESLIAEFVEFSFLEPMHRLIIPEMLLPPPICSGIIILECKVRRAQEKDWIATQSFPIIAQEGMHPQMQMEIVPEQKESADQP
jgi:hypothetical protein